MKDWQWLKDHRALRPYRLGKVETDGPTYTRKDASGNKLLADVGFNSHDINDGQHVSPFDEGRVLVGADALTVELIQGVHEESFARVLSEALRATTGIAPGTPADPEDADEMMRGGLQAALETQTIIFRVTGASRALTHQLVRTRKAGFHQQSQRATWYGDRPNFRMPMSVFVHSKPTPEKEEEYKSSAIGGAEDPKLLRSVRDSWDVALLACWEAYKAACDAGISYQDARYILPEGTTNYILCEYTVREFINVFAYRGCSMFLWEMVACMREMRRVLLEAHPFLGPHVKISCEKTGGACFKCHGSGWLHRDGVAATTEEIEEWQRSGANGPYQLVRCDGCDGIGGSQQCTFQGWENVEGVCDFPWARQDNRVFLPKPKYRIGA